MTEHFREAVLFVLQHGKKDGGFQEQTSSNVILFRHARSTITATYISKQNPLLVRIACPASDTAKTNNMATIRIIKARY